MLQDLSADRVPGLRRSTVAARTATALADGYQGLREGVTRWRLAAALRAAARPLGLTASMLALLEHYIDLSYDEDWEAGAEPVIVRPLIEIAEHLGKSERQVRNIERALVERGLLAWRDSGNHHRKGRRDRRTGRLVWAYGPSLAPLGARAAEIIALAETARRGIAEGRRLRIAIAALRRRLRADLAAAAAAGIDAADVAEAFAASPERAPAGLPIEVLSARRDALAALAERLLDRLGGPADAAFSPEISAKPETGGRLKTDTCNHNAINGHSIAGEKAKRWRRDSAGDGGTAAPADMGLSHIPLALALAAAGPELAAATARHGPPSWRGLVEAARETAPFLGIDAGLWGDACGALGRNGAALAALILERALARGPDDPAPPVAKPAAWFRSLVGRAGEGRLHLDRSIRALAQRPAGVRPAGVRSAGMRAAAAPPERFS